jgi:hypothetical protein
MVLVAMNHSEGDNCLPFLTVEQGVKPNFLHFDCAGTGWPAK